MPESLIDKGIKRVMKAPLADIETCKIYRPGAVCALGVIAEKYGLANTWQLFLKYVIPDWLISGYRDASEDKKVKNSPHGWGDAFDIMVGGPIKQIEFLKLALQDTQLFNRGGIYVGRNTCHIDQRNEEWMKKYSGSKTWVWHNGNYTGFNSLMEAGQFALNLHW